MDADDVARGVAHFTTVRQRDGRFHWELINPRGTPVVRSMETFDTEGAAAANAEYARHLISGAPIKRWATHTD